MAADKFVVQESIAGNPNTSNQQAVSNTVNGITVKTPVMTIADASSNDAIGAAFGLTQVQLAALGSSFPGILNLLAGLYSITGANFSQVISSISTTNSDLQVINASLATVNSNLSNIALNTSGGGNAPVVAGLTAIVADSQTNTQPLVAQMLAELKLLTLITADSYGYKDNIDELRQNILSDIMTNN
jgi:hypothetical protein